MYDMWSRKLRVAVRGRWPLMLRTGWVVASRRADAYAKDSRMTDPDEVRRYMLAPRLEPGIDKRRALGLGIQMMCRSARQHDPPLVCLHVDLIHLYGNLVIGVRNTGAQVLVKDGVPRAQDKRPSVDLVRDRQRREPVPAGEDQSPQPSFGDQVHAFGLAQALQHAPGIRSRVGHSRTAGRTEVGFIIRHSSNPSRLSGGSTWPPQGCAARKPGRRAPQRGPGDQRGHAGPVSGV